VAPEPALAEAHPPRPPPTLAGCLAVYPDGKVCISILHKPGTDRFNEMETAEERWRPILSVEAVLVSILSLFSDPNDSSPANIDAGKLWREDRKMFNRRARRCAQRTLE